MRLLIFSFIVACFYVLPSCMEPDDAEIIPGREGIWVINEGVFNSGNGGIGYLNTDYQYFDDLFSQTNGYRAGDVVQQLVRYKDYLYMVVNNSGKIEKLNADHLKSQAMANYFLSPRKICIWDDSNAYVTDLYKDVIYRINPGDMTLKEEIPCDGWTESIERVADKLWIVNIEKETLLGYNTDIKRFTDTIKLMKSPGDMVVDRNGKIWVFCGGDSLSGGRLLRINPENRQIEADLKSSPVKEFIPRMCINKTGDLLYLLHSGVYKVPVNSSLMPSSRFIGPGEFPYYGIGLNHKNGDVLISQVQDFTTPSKILVFDINGISKMPPISGGMITSSFLTK